MGLERQFWRNSSRVVMRSSSIGYSVLRIVTFFFGMGGINYYGLDFYRIYLNHTKSEYLLHTSHPIGIVEILKFAYFEKVSDFMVYSFNMISTFFTT
jgi:hypothetical protein